MGGNPETVDDTSISINSEIGYEVQIRTHTTTADGEAAQGSWITVCDYTLGVGALPAGLTLSGDGTLYIHTHTCTVSGLVLQTGYDARVTPRTAAFATELASDSIGIIQDQNVDTFGHTLRAPSTPSIKFLMQQEVMTAQLQQLQLCRAISIKLRLKHLRI